MYRALADISRSALLSWQRNPCIDCKSVQQWGTRGHSYHSPNYIQVRAVVWECGEVHTDRHIGTQTRVTNIHFASATPHAKCKQICDASEDDFGQAVR